MRIDIVGGRHENNRQRIADDQILGSNLLQSEHDERIPERSDPDSSSDDFREAKAMAHYRHLRGQGYQRLQAEPAGTGSPDAGCLPTEVRRGTGRTVRPLCPVCEALDSGLGDVSGAWDPFHFAVRVDRYPDRNRQDDFHGASSGSGTRTFPDPGAGANGRGPGETGRQALGASEERDC